MNNVCMHARVTKGRIENEGNKEGLHEGRDGRIDGGLNKGLDT